MPPTAPCTRWLRVLALNSSISPSTRNQAGMDVSCRHKFEQAASDGPSLSRGRGALRTTAYSNIPKVGGRDRLRAFPFANAQILNNLNLQAEARPFFPVLPPRIGLRAPASAGPTTIDRE